jgi:hypothetical protein
LDLEWETACLHATEETEAAQVVTVNIKAIDGKTIDRPSGFTISFKQQTSPPSLLRLESAPNPSASNKDVAESWREPPQYLRLALSTTNQTSNGEGKVSSLEDEIRELKALEIELEAIQSLIAEKKKQIDSHIRQEAQELSHDLGECDGISCVLKTIAHKAHGAWKIVVFHLKPSHQSKDLGSPEQVFAKAHGHAAQVAHMSGDHFSVGSPTPHVYEAKAVCDSLSCPIEDK